MFGGKKTELEAPQEDAHAKRYADPNADCPMWQAPCKKHGCRFYIQVIGQNPNTGEDVNRWDCAIAFLPMLLIENSQQQRQTGASIDSFRNEMVKQNNDLQKYIGAPPSKPATPPKLVGG